MGPQKLAKRLVYLFIEKSESADIRNLIHNTFLGSFNNLEKIISIFYSFDLIVHPEKLNFLKSQQIIRVWL